MSRYSFCLLFSFFAGTDTALPLLQHSEQPRNVTAPLGANVTFRCAISNAHGRIPRVQWRVNDGSLLGFGHGPVIGYPRYTVVGDQAAGEFHLQIINVSPSIFFLILFTS